MAEKVWQLGFCLSWQEITTAFLHSTNQEAGLHCNLQALSLAATYAN